MNSKSLPHITSESRDPEVENALNRIFNRSQMTTAMIAEYYQIIVDRSTDSHLAALYDGLNMALAATGENVVDTLATMDKKDAVDMLSIKLAVNKLVNDVLSKSNQTREKITAALQYAVMKEAAKRLKDSLKKENTNT